MSRLILRGTNVVEDPSQTVWWDLHRVAQEEAGLRNEKLCVSVGKGRRESREGKSEDAKKT